MRKESQMSVPFLARASRSKGCHLLTNKKGIDSGNGSKGERLWLNSGKDVDLPEKAIAPHSSTLAWKIPWTEEPGRLQSMGLLRVRHD